MVKWEIISLFTRISTVLFWIAPVFAAPPLLPKLKFRPPPPNNVVYLSDHCSKALSRPQKAREHDQLVKTVEELITRPEIRGYYYQLARQRSGLGESFNSIDFDRRFSLLGIRQFWKALPLKDRKTFAYTVLPSTERLQKSNPQRLQRVFVDGWLTSKSEFSSPKEALFYAFSAYTYRGPVEVSAIEHDLNQLFSNKGSLGSGGTQKELLLKAEEIVLKFPQTDLGVLRSLDFLAALWRLRGETDQPQINHQLNNDLKAIEPVFSDKRSYDHLNFSYRPLFSFIQLSSATQNREEFQKRLLLRASEYPVIKKKMDEVIYSYLLFLAGSPTVPTQKIKMAKLRWLVLNGRVPPLLESLLEQVKDSIFDPLVQVHNLTEHLRGQLVRIAIHGEYLHQLSKKEKSINYEVHQLFKEFNPNRREKDLLPLRAIAFHTSMKPLWSLLNIPDRESVVMARKAVENKAYRRDLEKALDQFFPGGPYLKGAVLNEVSVLDRMRQNLKIPESENLGFEKKEWIHKFNHLTHVATPSLDPM
ncbi:hypothetical protein OAQ84_00520 [Bdellovibrionales bacterium]|nr:hypothetical protein [Bdellovibrionales bacterium]